MSSVNFAPKISTPVDFTKTLDTSRLEGYSVIITGGASGLGAAFAVDLASKGWVWPQNSQLYCLKV
jgi:hypothetical protein